MAAVLDHAHTLLTFGFTSNTLFRNGAYYVSKHY